MAQRERAEDIDEFFSRLSGRNHPLLRETTATLRIDLRWPTGVQHWYLQITGGSVQVTHGRRGANAVVTIDGDLFQQLVDGGRNAMTAALRSELVIRGDARLLVTLDRLFPGPPARPGPYRPVRSR